MSRRGGRRGGQGNRGRKSGRARGSVGGGSKGKGKSKGGASSGRRGGQGNRGRKTGRAKGTVSRQSVAKGLSRVGNVTRQLRQPMSGLASLGIRSVLNNPAVARSIAQYGANTFGAQNQRTRDMSKLSPQQQRKYQRLSEKTGRDYSVRNPTFRLNMNMRDIARFGGLDKQGWYSRVPASIRNAQINKQFYGNPMKKGWHSSQRTGRGQGIKLPIQLGGQDAATQTALRNAAESWLGGHQQRQAAEAQAQQQNQAVQRQNDYNVAQYESAKSRMGPQQDWLGSLYSSHNINQGKLDQGARDYWSNEAKTKGRDAVMQSIIGTSKAQGTYGGRKKPQRITTTGSGRSIPKRYQTTYKGRTVDSRFAGRTSYPSKEKRARERAKRKAQNQAKK